jgi:imidazolonepropionase-like amidohydrolase
MRRLFAALSLLLMAACVGPEAAGQGASGSLALTGVTVIDVAAAGPDSARIPNQTVLVHDGRITAVGKAGTTRIPRGARVLDGRGRFLIPGLWDSHTHLTMFGDAVLPLLVSQGVTSVRDMGGVPETLSGWQKSVASGERLGPRIFHAGSLIEAAWWLDRVSAGIKSTPELAYFPFLQVSPRLRLASAAEAPATVAQVKASGADLVKFRNLRGAEFQAVAAEAARLGLLLTGHVPRGIMPGEAAEAGMASVEHMETVSLALGNAPDRERRRQFERMAKAGTAITATMTTDVAYRQTPDARAYAIIDDMRNVIDARRRFLSPLALAAWRFGLDIKKLEGPGEDHAALHRRQLADLRLAADAGVRILIGTDITVSLIFPGYSVHEEMAYLVRKAGLTPLEALRGATLYAAQTMRDPVSGRISPGQRADMLLLSSDPLSRIEATSQIEAVVLNGRYLGRSQLRALQERSAAIAARESSSSK